MNYMAGFESFKCNYFHFCFFFSFVFQPDNYCCLKAFTCKCLKSAYWVWSSQYSVRLLFWNLKTLFNWRALGKNVLTDILRFFSFVLLSVRTFLPRALKLLISNLSFLFDEFYEQFYNRSKLFGGKQTLSSIVFSFISCSETSCWFKSFCTFINKINFAISSRLLIFSALVKVSMWSCESICHNSWDYLKSSALKSP